MGRNKIEPAMKAKQWKKGQSGNPKGCPKGTLHLTTILKKILSSEIKIKDPFDSKGKLTKKQLAEAIMLRYVANALKGDNYAIKDIMDRLEGEPEKTLNVRDIDISGLDKKTIKKIADNLIKKEIKHRI